MKDLIQIDVADGKLVEGKTFHRCIWKFNSLNTKSDLSIHFMVENPAKYLLSNKIYLFFTPTKIKNVNTVITQLIDDKSTQEFIKVAKTLGYKIGISLNLEQDATAIYPYIKDINYVQFMGVTPGYQGKYELNPKVLDKIKAFKNDFPTVTTLIDGGARQDNLSSIVNSGVDKIVVGSAIFNSTNPREKYLELEKTAHGSN